jgi:hypothetical protein
LFYFLKIYLWYFVTCDRWRNKMCLKITCTWDIYELHWKLYLVKYLLQIILVLTKQLQTQNCLIYSS